MPLFEDLKVFSGNAHPALAENICSYLGISMGRCEVFKFSNDEIFVKVLENVREKDVFLVQPMSRPVNDHLMELCIMIDAVRRASAGRIESPGIRLSANPLPMRHGSLPAVAAHVSRSSP